MERLKSELLASQAQLRVLVEDGAKRADHSIRKVKTVLMNPEFNQKWKEAVFPVINELVDDNPGLRGVELRKKLEEKCVADLALMGYNTKYIFGTRFVTISVNFPAFDS